MLTQNPTIHFPHTSPHTIVQNSYTWVEISTAALAHNIQQYRSIIGTAALACVVKSNAYGHGMEIVARECDKNNNVDWLCVISVQEALALRSIGIRKQLLVLSITLGDLYAAIAQAVDLVVYDWQTALMLNSIAQTLGTTVYVHIKIDTGLSRLGVLWEQAVEFVRTVSALAYTKIRGIFTHFADSESSDLSFCLLQLERFNTILSSLQSEGISIPLHHTSCSAATTATPLTHGTLARVGIGIYGLWPSPENKARTLELYPAFNLRPVMSWKTTIIQIKTLPAGSFVGYDRTHQLSHARTIATLPVGYWDGYDRELSNKAHVQIGHHLAPQVGRVAMNLMMVDITGIQAQVGDQVTLLGAHEAVNADRLAQLCNTINYEVVTRINPCLARILI